MQQPQEEPVSDINNCRRGGMRTIYWALLVAFAVGGLWLSAGCQENPPPQVAIPPADVRSSPSDQEPMKPLPAQAPPPEPQPPYADEPLVSQRPPEQAPFVDAYRRVGQPRIAVFVNRTLEGNVIPISSSVPLSHEETVRINSQGKTTYREQTDTYLHSGEYDEAAAKTIDYEAIETILTDWLSCEGAVTVISPDLARQRLTDQQVRDLQSGRPQVLSEVAQQLSADVLIQVQAHPTRQTQEGLEIRLIAEAMNTRGGESIGRAVVDVPPPLTKPRINRYTRYIARKLMDDMTGSWLNTPPGAKTTDLPSAAPSSAGPSNAAPQNAEPSNAAPAAPPAPAEAQPKQQPMPPLFEPAEPTTAPAMTPATQGS
jgi:hypothetical protein